MLTLEAIPVTIAATGISFLWAFASGSKRSFGTFLLVSLVTLANLLWQAWFFRDGMGPDAITTFGLRAWQHFWAGAAMPVVAWVALALPAGLRCWHAARTRPNNSFKGKPLRGSP